MEPPEDERTPLDEAEGIILRWDSTASEEAREKMIFDSDRNEVDRYLQAVDEIQRSLSSTTINSESSSNSNSNSDESGLNSTIRIAMARMEDEFRNLLPSHTAPIEAESISFSSDPNMSLKLAQQREEQEKGEGEGGDSVSDGAGSGRLSYLRSIAERMIAAGYLRECILVYGSVRKSAVDASFRRLEIEKLSIGDVQRLEWDQVEVKIRRLIRAAKVCVRVLFAREKKLCKQIFENLGTGIDDACFFETVKGPAIQLFNLFEAISFSCRSLEKLFNILELHDALMVLIPDIDILFVAKTAESIRIQAAGILSQLAETARGISSDIEKAVTRDPSGVSEPRGSIQPLTIYVMNYISSISVYKKTLIEVIVSKPSTGTRYGSDPTPDMEFADELKGKTPWELYLIWMIVILQFKLEGNSKHYKDTSLAHLFMMNNVHYIVQKVKESPELREMLGDDYLKKLIRKFRQAAMNFQRATWVRVLYCLREEGLDVTLSGSFSSGVSKSALRERFKSFNAMFEDVHRNQAQWLVPDAQLREELRIYISLNVLPAYRSFLGRFRTHSESWKHRENYIKYSVDDLETAVLDFFEGHPVSQHIRRRSS